MIGRTLGRYEITAKIGAGGMGEVYRAHDTHLEREVALKVLAAGLLSDEAAHSRFRKEALALSRLNHPNIATIYDFATEDGVDFLTMELIPGTSLREKMANGASLQHDVIVCGLQLADALAAAHDKGVIHRDLKPGNVMMTPEGRLKVLDFGLATMVRITGGSDATLSLTAGADRWAGTPSYMSPEQLRGQPADERSDIWSCGVVLYEMAAGHLPFQGETGFELSSAILREPPKPLPPETPAGLRETIQRCLAKDPAQRYQRASELRAALEALHSGISTPPSASARGNWSQSRPVPAAIVAIASLLAVVLVAFSVRLYLARTDPHVSAGSQLLLTDIANESQDPEFDSVTQLLRSQLDQSSYFRLMAPQQVEEVLARMVRPASQQLDPVTAREVAMRDAVPLVIFGTVSRVAEDFRLDMKLERVGNDPAYPASTWQFSQTAPSKKDFFDVVQHAGNWIRQQAGESATDISESDRRPQDITTDNWEALSLFTQAGKLGAQDRVAEAVDILKEAVDKDPQFAMAYMRLGDQQDALGFYGEGYASWRKALSLKGTRRLTRREELRIKGAYASDTGDLTGAIEAYRQYTIAFPNDYFGPFYRGIPLMLTGKVEEAIQVLQQAQSKAPEAYYPPEQLARFNLILANFADSSKYADGVRQLGQAEFARRIDGEAAFLQGDYSRARAIFATFEKSEDPFLRSVSYYYEACVSAELGKYNDAITKLNQGIAQDLSAGDASDRADKILGLAWLEFKKGDFSAARESALRSLALERGPRRAADVGSLLARAGFIREAQKVLANLDPSDYPPITDVVRLRLKGEILLAQGKSSKALNVLRQAHEKDQEWGFLHDYFARALAANGQFAEALEEYRRFAQHPGQVWQSPEDYPPGLAADLEFEVIRIASHLSPSGLSDSTKKAIKYHLTRYLALRHYADGQLPDVGQADDLAQQFAVSPR
jgi:serine/threonine protein kinase